MTVPYEALAPEPEARSTAELQGRPLGGVMSTSALNDRGEWVPAIPEPMFVGWRLRRCRCHCGQKFKDRTTYQGHYALVHVLALGLKR